MTSQAMCGEKQIKGDNIQIAMTMKKCILGLLVLLPILNSCKDDMPFGTGPVQNSGDGVVFNLVTEPTTRTMYEDDWDAESTQELYWGNYLADQGENVKIFCKNAQAGSNVATYTITPQSGNSQYAQGIAAQGAESVKWGEPYDTHNFYAFYPADKAGDQLLNGSDNTIRATIDQGQDPVGFRVVGKTEGLYSNLKEEADYYNTNLNNESSWKNTNYQTVIYGKPDMSAAVMVAHTEVAPSSAENSTWGQEVPLNFKVLADVLDFTINGPVTPNSLGGNAGDANAERNFIRVQSITVTHNSGKPIVGSFTLNMETGVATDVSDGVPTIQMRTGETINGTYYYPTLYVRKETTTPPPAGETDNLRVRCFLIPGSVQDLSELTVHVQTDCGDFDQQLGASPIGENGRIHRVKLGYFKLRGTQFDYSAWMGQLDPDIYISELSIPGTWHSTVEAYQGAGNNNLVAQYQKGIRAFELHAYGAYEINDDFTPASAYTYSCTSDDYEVVVPSSGTINSTRTIRLKSVSRSVNLTPSASDQSVMLVNWDTGKEVQLQALHNAMNSNAFCVVEIGYDATSRYGGQITSCTQTNSGTINGECTIVQSGNFGIYSDPTSTQISNALAQAGVSVTWSDPTYSDVKRSDASMDPMFVTAMNNVAEKYKDILYTDKITPNTTIRDVRNKIILKINTNDGKANEEGYITNFPGLFSRWYDEAGNPVLTTAMQWGAPIAPTASSDLYLVWSTKDRINAISNRTERIKEIGQISYERYNTGLHNTWYEISTGGCINDSPTAANCQSVAKDLNQAMIQALTDPTRPACPYGLIMMNYACDNTYYGQDLIRTIINNNAAFYLNRATPGDVNKSTNSSFTNNSNNPLK